MAVYLKEFSTHSEYDAYINGSGAILPNVSICTTEEDVHYNPYISVTSVSLDKHSITIQEGGSDTLIATVLPANATNKNVIWSSSNNWVATVTSGGVVTVVSTGSCIITVTTVDGEYTDTCELSVKSNRVITYTATEKLTETQFSSAYEGLHVNEFSGTSGQRLRMYYHTFSNGTGTITFNSDVASIGEYAFYKCSGLTSIAIPDSVTTIGNSAFSNCSGLTSINIPSGVTSISNYTFKGCSGLTSIDIPDSVTSIGMSAFENCYSLTSIDIPSGVTSIGESAFYNCSGLTGTLTIPSGVTSIGAFAFNDCENLSGSIIIPNGVTVINNGVFRGCSSVTSFTIPNAVTRIGDESFMYCSGITSIDIPSTVTSIGEGAFLTCKSLVSVICRPTTPPTGGHSTTFAGNASGRKIYVPADSVNAYKTDSGWWSFWKNSIEAIQ